MDDAEQIIDGAMTNHYDLVTQFRGVPGVKPHRLKEAMTIRHCALSLVGEPIMYPEINRFLEILHARRISSFLVTNAQFPEAIRNLTPVCQLYVSVDASTKVSHTHREWETHQRERGHCPPRSRSVIFTLYCHRRMGWGPSAMWSLTRDDPTCEQDQLQAIDRPLFSDFWPRLLDSLKALSEKGQRTVYRLTIVKAFNDDGGWRCTRGLALSLGGPGW